MRVVLDIGTAEPSAAHEVATRAVADHPGLHLTVVGPRPDGVADADRLAWRDASAPSPDVDPAVAVRGRADLSVRVALELGRDGHVDAVVAASPLSALLAGTRFLLRRRTGVRTALLATTVATDGGPVVVLDTSGRTGTTAGSLVAAATDVGAAPDRLGLLESGSGGHHAMAALEGHTGAEVRRVSAAEALVGAVPLVFADGAVGGLFVDTVRALAPDRIVTSRLVGLGDGPVVLPVGPDPSTWAPALAVSTALAA